MKARSNVRWQHCRLLAGRSEQSLQGHSRHLSRTSKANSHEFPLTTLHYSHRHSPEYLEQIWYICMSADKTADSDQSSLVRIHSFIAYLLRMSQTKFIYMSNKYGTSIGLVDRTKQSGQDLQCSQVSHRISRTKMVH